MRLRPCQGRASINHSVDGPPFRLDPQLLTCPSEQAQAAGEVRHPGRVGAALQGGLPCRRRATRAGVMGC